MRKPNPSKAVRQYKALRFSCREIHERVRNAENLSSVDDSDEWPSINVEWDPAKGGGIPLHGAAHSYSVAVDMPADRCYWAIRGRTMRELRRKLADGLAEQADYLEHVARYLRERAEFHRQMAETSVA